MKKQSAGLLVYRKMDNGIEVFLSHPGGPFFVNRDVWGIPKGEYDQGEEPKSVARREFEEETGQPPPRGEEIDLGEIKRSDGKVIKVWAVEGTSDIGFVKSNLFDLEWPPRSGKIQKFPEVDKAQWFALDQVSGKMHKGQEIFIERLANFLNVKLRKQNPGPDLPTPDQQSLL